MKRCGEPAPTAVENLGRGKPSAAQSEHPAEETRVLRKRRLVYVAARQVRVPAVEWQ